MSLCNFSLVASGPAGFGSGTGSSLGLVVFGVYLFSSWLVFRRRRELQFGVNGIVSCLFLVWLDASSAGGLNPRFWLLFSEFPFFSRDL